MSFSEIGLSPPGPRSNSSTHLAKKPRAEMLSSRLFGFPVRVDEILEDGEGRFRTLTGGRDDLLVPSFHISCRVNARNVGPVA